MKKSAFLFILLSFFAAKAQDYEMDSFIDDLMSKMTLQEKIQKKADEYGQFASVFLEGAKFALENQWIRVTDRLPEIEKDGLSIKVLVVSNKGKIHFSRYDYEMEGWISPNLDISFTHWMPIPELPKE